MGAIKACRARSSRSLPTSEWVNGLRIPFLSDAQNWHLMCVNLPGHALVRPRYPAYKVERDSLGAVMLKFISAFYRENPLYIR